MRQLFSIAFMCALFVSGAPAQERATRSGKEAFTAIAASTGGPRSNPVAGQLDIVIERWSTDAERERLMTALAKGQQTLVDELQDLSPVGYISSGGSLGWDLRYAHQTKGEDGGRRIFLATDRPVAEWEAFNRPRISDYPFTFIELRLNNDGEGEGKLSAATKVIRSKDGRFLELENWDVPVALNQVKPRR